jgi:hypothetical protein
MVLSLGAMAQAWESGDQGSDRGPMSSDIPPVWADSLDDMSHVFVPDGGLVGVEVVGGEARLKAGLDEGWVASSIIPAKSGYRYDFVVLEATTPGNSSVEISILNASKESSEIGFANETIAGFKRIEGTYLSLYSIPPAGYPELRIQVNLVAAGSDKPVLMAWSLYYVPLDEWRDDFVTKDKMASERGLNLTDGRLEINLSRGGGGSSTSGFYNKLPPIFSPHASAAQNSRFFFANGARTDYNDYTVFPHTGVSDAAFADLNKDGYLDMVMSRTGSGGGALDSYIFWGTDTEERWTDTGATVLDKGQALQVELGDVNGDGELDIVLAVQGSNEGGSSVFMNQGDGSFTNQATVTLTGKLHNLIDVGDLNNDGYDDLLLGNHQPDRYQLFYSDEDGPDDIVDLTFQGTDPCWNPKIVDINGDGFLDIILGTKIGGRVPIYLGSQSGPDGTPDIQLSYPHRMGGVGTGDINGDGYLDLVCGHADTAGKMMRIFKGSSSGWSDSNVHDISIIHAYKIEILDMDHDGYDDIVIPDGTTLKIFFGGETWPTTACLSKTGLALDWFVAVAAPEGEFVPALTGSFTTKPITLPPGNKWDIICLEGDLPKNTSMVLSVLDSQGNEIEGLKELADWNVDLLGLTESTIKIKVEIASELSASWVSTSGTVCFRPI